MPLDSGRPPINIYRLGTHAEAEYFRGLAITYDAMIVNANLAQATRKATASFLAGQAKPYFIDPVTYAFGLRPSALFTQSDDPKKRGTLKRSFSGLSKKYGRIIGEKAGETAIQVEDFADAQDIDDLARSVATYQISLFDEDVTEMREADPERFSSTFILKPEAIIAPYFHIDYIGGEKVSNIIGLNTNLVQATVSSSERYPTFAMLCLSRNMLFDEKVLLEEIASSYLKTDADGFFFWFDDLTERSASIMEIKNLIRFIQMMREGKRPIYNAYGGCLSAFLSQYGLTGFSHGLGYGERRSIEPVVGGGVPPPKYYVPPLHDRYQIEDVLFIAKYIGSCENFHKEICNCQVCQLTLKGNTDLLMEFGRTEAKFDKNRRRIAVPTAQSLRLCRLHYMLAMRNEVERIRSDWQGMVANLDKSADSFSTILGKKDMAHLRIWYKALTS